MPSKSWKKRKETQQRIQKLRANGNQESTTSNFSEIQQESNRNTDNVSNTPGLFLNFVVILISNQGNATTSFNFVSPSAREMRKRDLSDGMTFFN